MRNEDDSHYLSQDEELEIEDGVCYFHVRLFPFKYNRTPHFPPPSSTNRSKLHVCLDVVTLQVFELHVSECTHILLFSLDGHK